MCIETIENSELDFHTNVSILLVNVLKCMAKLSVYLDDSCEQQKVAAINKL
jgi:hypothetical protein